MTPLSFICYTSLTILVLILVRLFWIQILIAGAIIYYTGVLVSMAATSAVIWAVFIARSSVGWGWTFLYFFLAYIGIAIVGGLIISDLFNMVSDSVIRFFKKLK